MKTYLSCVFSICLGILLFSSPAPAQPFTYPPTPRHPVADTIFGKVVVDNYRWMEDMNSPQMKDWLKAQADYTNSWLDRIPGRDAMVEDYKKLDQSATADVSLFLLREGGRYFYTKTLKGENVGKLYYRQGKGGREVPLFDPASYASPSSKPVTFTFLPSKDGKKVALAITDNGKLDVRIVRVLNVDTRSFYPDSIYPARSVQSWSPDSKGFFYGSLQTSDHQSNDLFKDIQIKYHKLGTKAEEDKIVLARTTHPEQDLTPSDLLFNQVALSPDNIYLTIDLPKGLFYTPVSNLIQKHLNWKQLGKAEDRITGPMIYRDTVYFISHGQVLASPVMGFNVATARVIIPDNGKRVEWLKISRDFLFVVKSDGISTTVEQHHFASGRAETIQPPIAGNAWLYTLDANTNDCIINLLSWQKPLTRFDYDPLTHNFSLSPFNTSPRYAGVDDLVAEEVIVKSHDGVMIPLSLIYHKNLKRDGSNIVYMSGYGAYGSYRIPFFNLQFLPLLNRGIVIAITHVRGGGEKGEVWHRGGFKDTKPNTWKDFIACAEFMIAEGYTSARLLIGEGFSAGGILVGRAMTERPDLFAATIHNVPLSNPLRGENRPNGMADANEFGSVRDSTEALGLLHMDTYHHIKPGVHYPAVLATAGINDSRIPPWQPGKLVAAMQRVSPADKPVLLLVNYDSGHLSEEKFVALRNYANQFSFALWQVGHPEFQPKVMVEKK